MESPATVLVIEDSPVVQYLLRATLAPTGLEVLFADEGETGLELARARLPEVVTLDIGLPGIDGWQVLEALRSDAATARISVIVLTAHAQESMKQNAFELGADAFMTKPFRPGDLRHEVDSILRRSMAGAVLI